MPISLIQGERALGRVSKDRAGTTVQLGKNGMLLMKQTPLNYRDSVTALQGILIAYHAAADRRSRAAMPGLFAEAFEGRSN
jgi:hypothetical protein